MKSVWEAIVSYIPLRSQEILTKNEPELSETFLSHASESDSFISFESKKDGYFRRLHQRQIKIRFYHLICLVLIAITVVITTLSFLWTFGNSDISCARRLSVWCQLSYLYYLLYPYPEFIWLFIYWFQSSACLGRCRIRGIWLREYVWSAEHLQRTTDSCLGESMERSLARWAHRLHTTVKTALTCQQSEI